MDITRALPQTVLVLDPNGRKFDQVIQYAWKSMYCGTCCQLAHDCAWINKRKLRQNKSNRHKRLTTMFHRVEGKKLLIGGSKKP